MGAAATKAGVTMADSMEIGGTTVHLNGLGVRSFTLLQIRGYVAGLYLTKPTHDPEVALSEPGAKALVIQYVRGASASQVHDLYMDSSRKYCAHNTCDQQNKTSFQNLLETVRDVKPGDITSFLISDAGVQVLFNGKEIANLKDPSFGRVILDSDLGANPPSVELKNGLLAREAT